MIGAIGAAQRASAKWVSVLLALLVALLILAGCKDDPPKKLPPSLQTSAELRLVRRGVTVVPRGETERAPHARERLGEGAEVKIADGGLAWIRRDGGTTMLVRGPGKVILEADGLKIEAGKVFAETPAGRTETIAVPEGPLVLSAVRASLDVAGGTSQAYVIEGEIRFGSTVARAGELLNLGAKPSVEPALAWEDWTGGLATTDPASEPAPFGVGTVGARRPGSAGTPHAALTIQRLDVRVRIEGDLAITEVDETFFNPLSETVEGVYRFRAPEGALLERFGVDRDGGILYGFVKEKQQAQAQYQANVYEGSKEDPALLTWQGPGQYEARLYPILPGATRRVVVRYSEWLARSGEKGERRLYSYPMAFEGTEASAPQIEDLSIEVDVSAANAKQIKPTTAAVRVGDVVVVRDHDMVPRADFALELFDDGSTATRAGRAKHLPDLVALGPEEAKDVRRKGEGEADYIVVPVRATDMPEREAGLDLVLVVDTSAATDKATLRLARSATNALLAHLGKSDRVLVLAGDDRVRPVAPARAELANVDAALKQEVLEGLAKVEAGGATDLAAMLGEATTKVGDSRASAIVYIGDGNSTVGETDLAAIRERMKKAPRLVRLFGLGVGDGANMATLAGLSTGGFAERLTDDRSAARAALRLLEVAEKTTDLGATLDLGPHVERVYPRELGAVSAGETVFVVGRVTGESPTEATLTTARGKSTIKLDVKPSTDLGDLRRRWAMGRLDELLAENAGHAALVDLGVRQGVITPVTSIYVPTSKEMTREQRDQIDRRKRKRVVVTEPPEEQKADKTLVAAAPAATAAASARSEREQNGTDYDSKKKSKNIDDVSDLEESPKGGSKDNSKRYAPEASEGAKADEGQMGSPAQRPRGKAEDKPDANEPAPMASPTATAVPMPAAAPDSGAAPPRAVDPGPADRLGGNSGIKTPAAPGPGSLSGKGEGGGGRADLAKQAELAKPFGLIDMPSVPADSSAYAWADQGESFRGAYDGDGWASGTRLDANKLTSETTTIDGKFVALAPRSVIVVIDNPGRIIKLCGKGADVPFEERKNLWRERLSKTNASAALVLNVYRQAKLLCEAPTMRERRALLTLGLDYLPSIAARVSFYRLLARDALAADVVYRGILARVTTPAQVRELNQAMGLATVDSETLEKTIKEAKDPADLVQKLRLLLSKFPDDRALALKLLDKLEDAGDEPAARLLAQQLRKRSDADAMLRTAVGELYLRLSAKKTTPDAKAADEQEAKRAFGEIVEFSPDDPVARRRLGDLYRAHGYYAEATRQYETLARLLPDDPTVAILLAASANGLGKLEEAVRWTEKGGQAGAPDVSQGPHATARAFAALFLAWGRMEAKAASKNDEWKALAARLEKVLSGEKREGKVRVLLSWAHPELHPALWTNALGTMMPSGEGDLSLGLAQGILVDRAGGIVEVRVEPTELEHTARLGAKATLTTIFNEGKEGEVIDKREITFTRTEGTLRFRVESKTVESVPVEQALIEVKK